MSAHDALVELSGALNVLASSLAWVDPRGVDARFEVANALRLPEELGRERFDALWADLSEMLRDGERAGRIETLRPEHDPAMLEEPDAGAVCASVVYAYRRTGQPCLVCGTPIARAKHQARNLFWCPGCQSR